MQTPNSKGYTLCFNINLPFLFTKASITSDELAKTNVFLAHSLTVSSKFGRLSVRPIQSPLGLTHLLVWEPLLADQSQIFLMDRSEIFSVIPSHQELIPVEICPASLSTNCEDLSILPTYTPFVTKNADIQAMALRRVTFHFFSQLTVLPNWMPN